MTKKSYARQQRDQATKKLNEERKSNTAWDELKGLHGSILEMVIKTSSEITSMFSIPELHRFLDNHKETSSLIKCLADDTMQISQELKNIFELHKDKSGGWNTDEEYFATLQIYESYSSLFNKLHGVVLPNFEQLSTQYLNAVNKANTYLEEAKKQEDLTDPDVITDVEPKA